MFSSGRWTPTVWVTLIVVVALGSQVVGSAAPPVPSPGNGGPSSGPLPAAARPLPHLPLAPGPAAASPLLDPHWANLSSSGTSAPPSAPATLVYDGQDGYALWFGLAAPGIPGGASWTFASGVWINRTATAGAGPGGATWGTAAYDAGDGYVLWYGGSASPTSSVTWKFAAGKWTNLTSTLTTSPTPSRQFASASYDPAIGAVVLFGGWDGSAYLNDTWTFLHGGWSRVTTVAAPAPRVTAGLAYDGSDGYLLLSGGGTSSGPAADSWSFNGTTWSAVGGSGGPVGIGGDQGLTAAPGGGVVGFGGAGCLMPLQGPCNFTYEFSAGAWHLVSAGGTPSARLGMQLTYDANDATVLGWGGTPGRGWLNDTWALGGAIHLRASAIPPIVPPDGPSYFVAVAGGGYGNYSFSWTGTPSDCPPVNASQMLCESEVPGNYTLVSHLVDAAGNATSALASFEVLYRLSSQLVITPQTIDVGQTANLRVIVSGGDRVVNYTWVGLPAACSKANWSEVNCTPTNPGYFSVEVTITDSLGDVTTSPDLALFVNALPTVGIWSNASLGTAPFAVQFSSTVAGGSPTFSFLWAFGDGTSGTGPDPVHQFSVAGVYSVGTTVTDALGGTVGSINLSIDVLNPLVLQPHASSTYPSTGQTVTFTAVISGGGAPYSYTWTFGDGVSSSAASAGHAFASAGAHTVVLVVTDSHGLTAVGTVVVDVQGAATSGSGPTSFLSSPWVAGLLGAAIGIAVTALVIRPTAPGPREGREPRPSAADEDATTRRRAAPDPRA